MADLPKPLRDLVGVFERLPGIGPKSATRLAFYLLNTPANFTHEMALVLEGFREKIKICRDCFNVSEDEVCTVCSSDKRNKNIVCVVEKVVDLISVENTGGYNGVYHVLGGVINPLDHVGPEDLRISELIEKIKKLAESNSAADNLEIILATNPTMEGEATALYIKNKIEGLNSENIKVTRIGSGLPMGADMEYADMSTLSRALEGRREL